jgi:siderophore synthetase component
VKNIFSIAKNKNGGELFHLYLFLERYINDGSSSGFDLGLPEKYSPFNKGQFLEIPFFNDDGRKHLQIGTIPNFLGKDFKKIPFLIHPLIVEEIRDFKNLISRSSQKIKVEPTASGRTVFWEDGQNKGFIKLHFPLVLGRFNRELNLFRWLSALERSRELFSSLPLFPTSLGFLYDSGGTFHQDQKQKLNFGTIFREATPRPIRKNQTLLIPSFSLFAVTRNNGRGQSVLADFNEEIKIDDEQFLSLFVYPLIDSYIFMISELGIIPECNAQNLLYEYDLKQQTTRIIIRDMGDCFVDFAIRERQNLHTNFCSYKTLDPSKHKDIYQRRSFAFDFKLSHYVLLPLIQEYCNVKGYDSLKIITKVKTYFTSKFAEYKDYFNSTKWYSYPNEEGVSRDSYLENEDPLFR